MCQNAFFPGLQGIRMRRSKREKQKTDVWPDKKRLNPEFRKKLRCKSIQSTEKRKQDTQQIQIDGSEKSKII